MRGAASGVAPDTADPCVNAVEPSRWLVLSVGLPDADLAAELAAELIALGGSAVEEREGRLTTFLPPPDDPAALVADASRRLREVAGTHADALEIEWTWQAAEDWAARWREGLGPRRVGERTMVAPTWSDVDAAPDEIVIRVDPQMAFGTGEHATTRGALRLLERCLRRGDRVLDAGTGSGILAIAAALLGAAEVWAVESDGDAATIALENVERNGVAGRVRLVHQVVDPAYLGALGAARFDVITANILSSVLRPLLPPFRTAQPPGGRLILAGILEDEAERMIDEAERAGYALAAEDLEDEWWSGLFRVRAVAPAP